MTMTFAEQYKWAVYKPNTLGVHTAYPTMDEAFVRALDLGMLFCLFDEWIEREERKFLDEAIKEVTKEEFEEMLCVLPPRRWKSVQMNGRTIERFNMCEFSTGDITVQYVRDGDKFFSLYVRDHQPETFYENRKV